MKVIHICAVRNHFSFVQNSISCWFSFDKNNRFDFFFAEANRKFDTNASSTYKPFTENPKFTIDYIGGELTGQRAYETVSVIKNHLFNDKFVQFLFIVRLLFCRLAI